MGFFTFLERKLPLDTAQIERAISHLERQTSAELRVVVERNTKSDSALVRAKGLFQELEMHKTKDRNGVLLYLCFQPHYIAVVGDEAINDKVGDDFWQYLYQSMKFDCQQGEFTQAICNGIKQMEKPLAEHFPFRADDEDELPNEVVIK